MESLAAALELAREKLARGGKPHALGQGVPKPGRFHSGPIKAPVAGRTDHLPMKVRSNSYVLPADVVSALGEGNTDAGYDVVNRTFPPYKGKFADGGSVDNDQGIDIEAAGGEVVLSPEQVAGAGEGSLKNGHDTLDNFIKMIRKQTIKTLQKLPGPAKGHE